jgi:GTPase SAR1 family protein
MKKENIAKIVIIGEAKVGKTSLLTRYSGINKIYK